MSHPQAQISTKAQRRKGRDNHLCLSPLCLCACAPRCQEVVGSLFIAVALVIGPFPPAVAQDNPQPSGSASADELALDQSRVADKYAKLEQLMLKMAELESLTNPKRAQLLTRAVEQSKERLTKTQLDNLVKLLNQKQLKRAVDGQTTVHTDLKALLELLMSEDRSDRLKSEQQRLKEYIKEVERLIRLERSLQGQTEAGADNKRMAQEQGRIAEQTGAWPEKFARTKKAISSNRPRNNSQAKSSRAIKTNRISKARTISRASSNKAKTASRATLPNR